MDFSTEKMQTALQKSIIEFAKKELNDNVQEKDHEGSFSSAEWKSCADFGIIGLPLPAVYGGHGESYLTTLMALEALGYACHDNGLVHALITQILCGILLAHFGSETLKNKYLPGICSGDVICAQGITEPDSGSDALAMVTAAERENGGYRLTGSKIFISNGSIADIVIVFAVTDPALKQLGGVSCFLVETSQSEFHCGNPLSKMGLRTLQNCEIALDGCWVPDQQLIGKIGRGLAIFNQSMLVERTLMFGAHLGVMQRVIERCVSYANGRHIGGQSLGKYQSISNKIADMRVKLELGKLMLYKSAWLLDSKQRAHMEASIAKLFISESIQQICLDAVQLHGGYGYMKEFEIERELRDSIAATIYSGTSEVQRTIIARLAGLK